MEPTKIGDWNDEWTTSGKEVFDPTSPSARDARLLLWTVSGTSGLSAIGNDAGNGFFVFLQGTNAGSFPSREDSPVSSAVVEIRQRSRLTWEQLARVFGVKRRSLHFWASGARPSFENAQRIERVLAIMRHLDTGNAERTRAELLRPSRTGVSIFELLCASRDEDVFVLLGSAESSRASTPPTSRPRRPPGISTVERDRRRGFSALDLLDARHDDVPLPGRFIGAVPVPGCKV